MGIWGSSLYSNDCTCDIRENYRKFLLETGDNETAYHMLVEQYREVIESDEEPLFWYALADTQWRLGRLAPDVKEKALFWIAQKGYMDNWDFGPISQGAWQKTLDKLYARLVTPQPPEKKLRKPAEFKPNPWNIGDVYAYRFETEEAKQNGIYGKYILIQKILDYPFFNNQFVSRVRIFDKLFDQVPEEPNLDEFRLIPFDHPGRFLPNGRPKTFPQLNLCVHLEIMRKRDYPEKQLTYVCSCPLPEKLPFCQKWVSNFYWKGFEKDLLFFFSSWQDYSYQIFDDHAVVTQR